jgi:hypothetical protein
MTTEDEQHVCSKDAWMAAGQLATVKSAPEMFFIAGLTKGYIIANLIKLMY